MMLYLAAAGRQVGGPVADATLYFLRPGLAHSFAGGREALAGQDATLPELAEQLARCRRSGEFPRRGGDLCSGCPYASLCLRPGR